MTNRLLYRFRYQLSAVFVMPFLSCHEMYPSWELDFVARSIDKYGTVSLSGATLIEPDPRFQLDLELTGNEIFKRNRIEGFSNIAQREAVDMQISVQAEIIQDLMSQMEATESPKLLAKLREQLQAAAFKNLLAFLPEEQQAGFADLVSPPASQEGGGDGEEKGSDGGDGKLIDAHAIFAKAKAAFEEAKTVAKAEPVLGATNSSSLTSEEKEKAKSALSAIRSAVKTSLTHMKSATTLASEAASQALGMAIEAERKIATLDEKQRLASGDALAFARTARTAAVEARTDAETLNAKIGEILGKLDELGNDKNKSAKENASDLLGKNDNDGPEAATAELFIRDLANWPGPHRRASVC